MDREYREALVWGSGAICWFGALLAITPVVGFLLAPVTDIVIENSPGWVATAAIETFGKAAKPLLSAGIALAVVGAASVTGYLRDRVLGEKRLEPFSFWGPALGGIVLYVGSPGPLRLVGFVIAGATGLPPYVFAYFSRPASHRGTDYARRGVLRRVAAGAGAVGALGVLSQITNRTSSRDGATRAADPLPERNKRETGRTIGTPTPNNGTAVDTDGEFGFDFGAMPPQVGSIENHYIVDINTQDPVVDTDAWELGVTGAVETSYTLSLSDLIEHAEAVSVPVTMVCISNPVGGNLISTTTWQGVPLDTILNRAGVQESGVDVVTKAADGYSEAIPIETAREMDAFIAFGADGETLPVSHGFPARLLIPGRYGMKSTKWVTEIELSTREHDAFWEKRGWNEEAVINTLSYARAATRTGDTVAVGGIAYAGTRGIQTVEVSRDGGDTWHEAELEAPPSEYAWRRWRHVFAAPDADRIEVIVRAVDGTGTLQTKTRSGPHPDGSTGWHHRTFTL